MDVTLTSTPAKVGTGDAAFYWATASVDEVNNIPDVAVVGDYFKVADEAPSDLDLRIPVKDVIGPLDTDANGITPEGVARIQGDNEESTLDNTFRGGYYERGLLRCPNGDQLALHRSDTFA